MLIRALIVLLIALNLGAAAWWISRPAPPPPPLPAMPQDAARLQLLSEAASTSVAPPAPLVTTPVAAPAEPAVAVVVPSPQCFSLGPFADAVAANAAATRLGKLATRPHPREVPSKNASGYNVYLPPSADRDAAQAVAQRIGAAGFDDYLVINSGELANGIALGRYRSRESAERRLSSLQAGGFPAQLQAIGDEGAAQWWLDLAAANGTTGPQLQALASAAQMRTLDCAALR